jgi:diacylglycerol kinase family enzyme
LSSPIFVVANPAAGKGRGAALVEPLLAALSTSAKVGRALTTRPGEEGELTRKALADGYRRIVALGGDGTWSNVGGPSSTPASRRARLVAGGPGATSRRPWGSPRATWGGGGVVLGGHTRTIDVGRVEETFLNVAASASTSP